MSRPKRPINQIDFDTMNTQQQAEMAKEDIRRILLSLRKAGRLREQDFGDVYNDLFGLFLSGEMSRMISKEKIAAGAKIGNYVYAVALSKAIDYLRGQRRMKDTEPERFDMLVRAKCKPEAVVERDANYARKVLSVLVSWLRKKGHLMKADLVEMLAQNVPEQEIMRRLGILDHRGYTAFVKASFKVIKTEFRVDGHAVENLLLDSELVEQNRLTVKATECKSDEMTVLDIWKQIQEEFKVLTDQIVFNEVKKGYMQVRKKFGTLYVKKASVEDMIVRLRKMKEIEETEKMIQKIDQVRKGT